MTHNNCYLKLAACPWPACDCPMKTTEVRSFRETVRWDAGDTFDQVVPRRPTQQTIPPRDKAK